MSPPRDPNELLRTLRPAYADVRSEGETDLIAAATASAGFGRFRHIADLHPSNSTLGVVPRGTRADTVALPSVRVCRPMGGEHAGIWSLIWHRVRRGDAQHVRLRRAELGRLAGPDA